MNLYSLTFSFIIHPLYRIMIRIAIADDEALFRKGLRSLLEDYENFTVILEAKDGQDLLE